VLQQKGHTHFLALAQVAGITEPAPSALLTIFAPTNQVCGLLNDDMQHITQG
jgi:hypothetical protein